MKVVSKFYNFIPAFLKGALLSLNLVRTVVPNRVACQKLKQNGKQLDPDEPMG